MISVVIPVYACAPLTKKLIDRLSRVLEVQEYEVVVVVDGLNDDWVSLSSWKAESGNQLSQVRLLQLARNYGQQAAIMAGLAHARGEVVAVMDGDLQDPPEILPKLLACLSTTVPIVIGRQAADGRVVISPRRLQSRIFAFFATRFLGSRASASESNFVVMTQSATKCVLDADEPGAHFLYAIHETGLNTSHVDYFKARRPEGASGYSFFRRARHATTGVLFLSGKPLLIAFWVGAAQALIALFILFVLVGRYVGGSETPSGWLALMSVLLMQGAFTSLLIGTIGLYVRLTVSTIRRRPRFRVKQEA